MTKEMRASVRLPLELPVELRWKSRKGSLRTTKGITGSISGNGLFVTVPRRPPRERPITFTIALPEEVTKVRLQLLCQGRVTRSIELDRGAGVGAIIDDYRLKRVH